VKGQSDGLPSGWTPVLTQPAPFSETVHKWVRGTRFRNFRTSTPGQPPPVKKFSRSRLLPFFSFSTRQEILNLAPPEKVTFSALLPLLLRHPFLRTRSLPAAALSAVSLSFRPSSTKVKTKASRLVLPPSPILRPFTFFPLFSTDSKQQQLTENFPTSLCRPMSPPTFRLIQPRV